MERESTSNAADAGPDLRVAVASASPSDPEAPERPAGQQRGPAPTGKPRLFIVHAPADAWFVDGFLLRAVPLREGEVLVSSKLDPGAVIVQEIERGAWSPVTVVVVSPALLASPWGQFAHQLALLHIIEASDGTALVASLLANYYLTLL